MGGNKKGKSSGKASKSPAEPSTPPVTIETLTQGDSNNRPKSGDAVTVHYVGSLVSDGSVFDSSRAKKVPFSFLLGSDGVIRGWNLGVAQMCLNQRSKLTIAAHAAYGEKGCEDKSKASGTGVIPPNADLIFDVELLDINFAVTLSRYRGTLDAWVTSKLTAFDDDAEARTPLEEKHGSRAAYELYLKGVAARKYQAEREKRFSSAGIDASRVPDPLGDIAEALGAVELSGRPNGGQSPGGSAPPSLYFDPRFAMFKVEPNDEEEAKQQMDGVAPRNLHNAAELFVHLSHNLSAANLHSSVTAALATFEAGPDGKSAQRLGRACVCWGCGHAGLPRNAAECSEKGPTPKGVCGRCGGDGQTNFLSCVTKDGRTMPWIEGADQQLTPAQLAKAEEAQQAAKAAEATEVS